MFCVEVEVPITQFKQGETLRITIEQYCANDSASDCIYAVGHDPKGRLTKSGSTFDWDGATPNGVSIALVSMPFKIGD